MLRTGFTLLLFFLIVFSLNAQVVINEASNKNYRQLADEDGEYNDWIELYNKGDNGIDLSGWALSDSKKNPAKWQFGNTILPSGGFLVIHASGKDRKALETEPFWESAILPTDTFSYIVPSASTSTAWFKPDFNDGSWSKGKAGFGYGDEDDRTTLPQQTVSVYLRCKFNVPDTSAILSAIFHVDFDDGFVAYLNGVEIARANMIQNPQWNSSATENHEAVMYSGGNPGAYEIDAQTLKSIIKQGRNVLCIQAHNVDATSSDFSIIPFLSFSLKEGKSFFRPVPNWFQTNRAGQLHANFKLSAEGENIYLTNDSVVVDSMNVPAMMLNHSYGRKTDGAGQNAIFVLATPGASNNSSTSYTGGYTSKPELSQVAGFYNSTVEVAITSLEQNPTIRYTLDGSEPTELSQKYTAPIKIRTTTSLKARSYTAGKLPGEVATATYLINEEFTVPVLSVTTNNSNLYGANGIFDNTNESWNVPSYIEYFEKDQQLAFSMNAGMQLDGGAGGSRTNPQHSFRIEPGNGTLGDGDLKYNLLHRRPNRNNFPSFYVRNGSNQYYGLRYKDALQVAALGRNTFTYYSAYQPIEVFLNGQYFGVYELREKINDDFLRDNYGMDIDSIDFLGMSYFYGTLHNGDRFSALRGSTAPYLADLERFKQLNIQSDNYLSEVDKFLDINSYTDYIIAENWVGNNDWPDNNLKVFRCKGTNFRWQWALNDLEWALMPNFWTTADFDHFSYLLSYGSDHSFTGFWYNMMQNATYKENFINRYADLMNTNYLYSVIGQLENEMYNEIFPEMDDHYERWGSGTITTQTNNFTRNHETFRTELKRRSSIVRTQIQSHYNLKNQITVTLDVEPKDAGSIQISTINPILFPWEGVYFTDLPITVTALPNPGYKFSKWNSTTFSTDSYNAVLIGKFKGTSLSLKAFFEPESNMDAGVVISEINFKSGKNFDSPDWIEFCNFGKQDVNLYGWYFTDEDSSHVFVFSQDVFLTPNQRIVVTNNIDKFRSQFSSIPLFPGEFDFGLGTPADEIHLYNTQQEKVFSVKYSDNYPWPLSDDLSGRTLELRTVGFDAHKSTTWFRGCIGGSPGSAYQPCDEEEIVSSPLVAAVSSFDVQVYPVPARDFITVEILLAEESQICNVQLYNLMGNLVKSISLNNTHLGLNTVRIPLEGVRGNMLLLKVNSDGYEKTMKILRME